MAGKYTRDTPKVAPLGNLRVVVSDPALDELPDGDPLKISKHITLAEMRAGQKVILNQSNTPLDVFPGQTVYVDTAGATGNLVANLPTAAPTTDDPITFLPVGPYSTYNLVVNPDSLPVNGEPGEDIICSTDNLAFQVRYVSEELGYVFFGQGSTYLTQNVTVNASDLVDIRYVETGNVQLVANDREHGVATVTNTSGGIIYLPDADDVNEGWQCSIFQLGDGVYTFELNSSASGEEIIALGNQMQTLGRGTMVTVLLTRNKKWLIGGGLTGV